MSSGLNTIDAVTRRWLADLEARVEVLERRLERFEGVPPKSTGTPASDDHETHAKLAAERLREGS